MNDQQGKQWIVALALCFFIGYLGAHRFYVGKTGTGIAMLLTCGGLGIWSLIDLVLILMNKFDDAEGRPLLK
ncbi:MAG: TM2 domain-containing protein [Deltaproteobacteria bacterium]|nr:TM2 domain-containing protein [Deltaproteobacteria bacterium]